MADTGNHRVLIWNQIPTSPNTPADIVVGQPDMQSKQANSGLGDQDGDGDIDASASSVFFPGGVWVDNNILYVADTYNHRILVFDPVPTQSNASAQRVIGQPDLQSNDPNRGGGWYAPASNSLLRPLGLHVAQDGTLLVADSENNRILGFAPLANSHSNATWVVGQTAFDTDQLPNYNPSTGVTPGFPRSEPQMRANATSLRRPRDAAIIDGQLVVADTNNHRIVAFPWPLTVSTGEQAIMVLGQSDFDSRTPNAPGVSEQALSAPAGLAVQGTTLWVAETNNHRVKRYDTPLDMNRVTAIIGQPDAFSTGINGSSSARNSFDQPGGLSWDGTHLWVADRAHHRVLALLDEAPQRVLGQADLNTILPNAGVATNAASLSRPTDVYADSDHVIIADRDNHRVLIWLTPPEDDAAPADVVIGQPDFTSNQPNAGRGFTRPAADTLLAPEGVFFDGQRLWIADTGNNRVLRYDQLPTQSGVAADHVLCQSDFSSNLVNAGRRGPDADTCAGPRDVLVVDAQVVVSDTLNNRVLLYNDDASTTADTVLGQPDVFSRSLPAPGSEIGPRALSNPTRLAFDGHNLLVSDAGHRRVLVFEPIPTTDYAAASGVIGQRTFETSIDDPNSTALLAVPDGLAAHPLPFNNTRVFIADRDDDRIAVFSGLARPIGGP